jgi:hypothetical protein
LADLSLKFSKIKDQLFANLVVHNDPYAAMTNTHANAILTEWDVTKFGEAHLKPTTGKRFTQTH